MSILKWFRHKKKITPTRREYLLDQLRQSRDFYTFFETAHRKGYASEIVMIVDGQVCPSSLQVNRKANRQLWELMCNFASAERYRILDAIDELDERSAGSTGPDDNIGPGTAIFGPEGYADPKKIEDPKENMDMPI